MFLKRIIALAICFVLYTTPSIASHTPNTRMIAKVMPSIVEVIAENLTSAKSDGGFKFRQKGDRDIINEQPTRSGSGFVISKEGHVITNAHVVGNVTNNRGVVHLKFKNGKLYDADVVGYDVESDIAVLKIKNPFKLEFPFLVWGETPEIGSKSFAIGSPMGLSFSTTFGNISALDRMVPNTPSYVPFIQTDTSINPGNSGGPLFNDHGQVVGINTMVMTNKGGGGSIGLGFAIDGDYAQTIIARLKLGEVIKRPFVGILFREINKKDIIEFEKKYGTLKTAFRYPKAGSGAYIQEIVPDGPAAGILQINDVLLELDGKSINPATLAKIITRKAPKDNVVLKVLRDGKIIIVNIILGYRSDTK